MKKRILALVCACVLLVLAIFTGCSGQANDDGTYPYRIGILQLFDHPALDAAREGFVGRLAEHGFQEGENVVFVVRNAQMDMSIATQMAEYLVEQDPHLILSIATGASQAVARATQDNPIPVVITAVTDPLTAELVESLERPGRNVTGVSDLTPVAMQIELITRLLPDTQTVGLLYNSGEINSVIQANMAREAAAALGFETITGNVPSMADVADVIQSLVGRVCVLYLPTCNTVAGAYPTVIMAADEAGIPVVAGEVAGVRAGALATEGIDYYLLGRQSADMAVQLLQGEAVPATMPIQWQQEAGTLAVNIASAERLGITIPPEILNAAGEIVEE